MHNQTYFDFTLLPMRAVIAYMFICIFSLQIIPIKEIGEKLYKQQITEEDVHSFSHSGDDNSKPKKEGDPFPFFGSTSQNHSRIEFLSRRLNTAIHRSENLPPPFVPDIITPPPNFLSQTS